MARKWRIDAFLEHFDVNISKAILSNYVKLEKDQVQVTHNFLKIFWLFDNSIDNCPNTLSLGCFSLAIFRKMEHIPKYRQKRNIQVSVENVFCCTVGYAKIRNSSYPFRTIHTLERLN